MLLKERDVGQNRGKIYGEDLMFHLSPLKSHWISSVVLGTEKLNPGLFCHSFPGCNTSEALLLRLFFFFVNFFFPAVPVVSGESLA